MSEQEETFVGPLTVQKFIWNFLLINLIVVSYLAYNPRAVAPIIKRKRVFMPIGTFLMILHVLFMRDAIKNYNKIQE